jgi:hypothetical protein
MIYREKARKLPGSASAVLQERLIRLAIAGWDGCARNYFDEVRDALREILAKLAEKYFGRYMDSGLYGDVMYPLHQKGRGD